MGKVSVINAEAAMGVALLAAPNGESRPKPRWQVLPLADLVGPAFIVGQIILSGNKERRPGA